MRRTLLLLPVALVGVAIASRTMPVRAEGVTVAPGTVAVEVLGVGTLESARDVRVSFEAAGRVTSLAVDEGNTVAEGDVLGTIDVDAAERELSAASAGESAAAAAVTRARAELRRAEASADRARVDRGRSDALLQGEVIATADHDVAIERELTTEAEVAALRAAVGQAERSLQAASATRGIRAAQLAEGRLRSPLSGLVVRRDIEVGQLVTPGTTAFTIVATDAMQVRAWVDEGALARLAVGQATRLRFRSDPDRDYPGTLARIGREVDRQTHELLVEIDVAELPPNFAVGQRADAWINLDSRPNTLMVPRGWCTSECLVVEEGRATSRPVTLGLQGRAEVEVVAGLTAGDIVLAPGTPVGKRVRAEAP